MKYWVIPPKHNSEFVAAMENILETYKTQYNPRTPVVCMDEQPIQLLDETREPIPETSRHSKRVDYEYKRCGTASIFMFVEPLTGLRWVDVQERQTKVDWCEEVQDIMKRFYPEASRVILVCDNLNTHTYGSFYERYVPSEALTISKRLEIRRTPKHGSWLNIAESELSVLTRQCLKDRRFPTVELLRQETTAWTIARNSQEKTLHWQFTTNDARIKLKSIYPLL